MAAPTPISPSGAGGLKRSDFPDDFIFGFAASAYQYEGGFEERGPNIWDTFLAKYYPDLVKDGGLNAIDHYHRYEEDIRIMKEMGIDSYRFSISWSRVLPTGRRFKNPWTGKVDGVNYKGIQFYQHLIRELKANGIEPMVTIFHWDLPQALEDEYQGFLDRTEPKKIVQDYCDYASLCFEYFGDHVKRWLTFNEPWNFAIGGYATGQHAPGRGGSRDLMRMIAAYLPSSRVTSAEIAAKIPSTPVEGDPKTEPYLVAHNILLAHAAAVKLYRTKFKEAQKGDIGISCETIWAVPYTPTIPDQEAAERVLEFMYGWFLNPITYGEYPTVMIERLKEKGRPLPPFSDEEKKDLKKSYDFLGLNYYTGNYVYDDESNAPKAFYTADSGGRCTPFGPDGKPIGEKAGSDWLYVYPEGLLELLNYIQEKYSDPNIYITENGRDELRDDKLSLWQSFFDYKRIEYHYKHLSAIKTVLNKNNPVKVKGYHAWTLMDNLEWCSGFSCRFGTNFIDFNNDLKRYPKLSAGWFKFLLQNDDDERKN